MESRTANTNNKLSPPSEVPDSFLNEEGRLISSLASTQIIELFKDEHAYPDGRYKKNDLEAALNQRHPDKPIKAAYWLQ